MISEDEARRTILENIRPLPSRTVSLANATGCFSANDLFAKIPLPIFDNSAMDGYAVLASSSGPNARLRVTGEQPAGLDRQLRVSAGEAVRIFTGAPMPAGADAVVMQEDVSRDGDEIVLQSKVEAGEFIRRRGCDLSDGQKILATGERIRPQTIALLASQGMVDLAVGGQVRVAVISTGDELIAPGEALQAGQLYESNSLLLRALLAKSGSTVISTQHCHDDADKIEMALREGAKADALVISGGVSVGARDYVKSALQSIGGEIDLWRVAIKPGKPFLFGRAGSCAIFGLPGNPVSAFVTFLVLVRPAFLKMIGAADSELALWKISAQLNVDVRNDGDRQHYLRGKLVDGNFTPIGRQESHALFGLSQSNALFSVAPGEKFSKGDRVSVLIWD
jgi:molybdopterin molybdotransferase